MTKEELKEESKAVSDTPIMDAVDAKCGELGVMDAICYAVCEGQKLELALNEANDRIKQLEEDLNELRSNEARLLNSNGELERRIKRLEEAGDLMVQHFYTDEPRSEMWEKAKEAKP
jgi:hypothetical protein